VALIRKMRFILLAIFIMLFAVSCSWKTRTFQRLEQDIQPPLKTITLDKTKDYYFFSDLHRGDGGDLDFFNPNRRLLSSILQELYTGYEGKDAVVFLVGDIEELWAYGFSLRYGDSDNFELNDLLDPRTDENQGIFSWEKKFSQEGRYFRIYGNHDDYWAKEENLRQSLLGENNIKVYPAIALRLHDDENYKILVTHGCQGHPLCDVNQYISPFAKELELYTWYYLKRIFLKAGERLRPKKLEKTRNEFEKQEKYLVEWADLKQLYLIVGHSHEPYINSQTFDCILAREIKNIRGIKLPLQKQNIKTIRENLFSLRGKDDAQSRRAQKTAQKQMKVEEIHLENMETEFTFLQNELSRRKKEREVRGFEEGPQDFYFNTGCCFAWNIMTAIKLEYKDEDWHAQLVSWEVKEGEKLLAKDTIKNVKEKVERKKLGQPTRLKAKKDSSL
jgi:UDP-2,3-diacylglucosamine pyrophosphatase LpxH